MKMVGTALKICAENYDGGTMLHASRVAGYVLNNPMVRDNLIEICLIVALCHDLIEDTDYTLEDMKRDFKPYDDNFLWHGKEPSTVVTEAVEILTKDKKEKYDDYISRVKEKSSHSLAGEVAYWVKIADIKDHLSQKETLGERRKEKYLSGLAILL